PVNIHDAEGVLVVTNAGIAGSLGFTADAAFGSFALNAKVKLEVNDTNQAVDATGAFGSLSLEAGRFIRVVAGLDLTFPGLEVSSTQVGDNSGNNSIQLGGSNISLSVADVVGLRGKLTFTRVAGKFLVGAAEASAFVGDGPAWLNNGEINPAAVGLLLEHITFKAAFYSTGAA